jgi:hypothetical protein
MSLAQQGNDIWPICRRYARTGSFRPSTRCVASRTRRRPCRECPPVAEMRTRLVPARGPRQGRGASMPVCRAFAQALWRTRTADPLLTMEVSGRHARTRAGIRGTVSPVNRLVERKNMRRETSRVSFLMCPFCVRGLMSLQTTATAATAFLAARPGRMRRAALGVQPHHERRGRSRLSRRGRLHRGRAR